MIKVINLNMAWPIGFMVIYGSLVLLAYPLAFGSYGAEARSFSPHLVDHQEAEQSANYDCKTAFHAQPIASHGRASSASAVRVGLVHRYGHCSPLKEHARSGAVSSKQAAILEDVIKKEPERIAFMDSKLGAAAGAPYTSDHAASLQAPLFSGQNVGTANYIMKVSLGTPSRALTLVVDTGSDLAWTQCLPCTNAGFCYMQKDSIFNPAASSTYKTVPCGSSLCSQLGASSAGTCTSNGVCEYGIQYLDGSFTTGDFAMDALAVGSQMNAVPSYAFGCGHDNEGLFQGFDGLLGLGRSSLGFPEQTKAVFGLTFAYCLPSPFSSSPGFIEFGTTAVEISSTPLLSKRSSASFYAVTLQAMAVGSSGPIAPPTGIMIVDSGTVITRLDRPLYTQVRDAFQRGTASLPPAPSGAGQGLFDTCYILQKLGSAGIPAITFKFTNGLDFTPPVDSLLYPVDNSGTYCLAFAPLDSNSGFSILGNYQQQGYVFSFDIARSTLGIKPGSC